MSGKTCNENNNEWFEMAEINKEITDWNSWDNDNCFSRGELDMNDFDLFLTMLKYNTVEAVRVAPPLARLKSSAEATWAPHWAKFSIYIFGENYK